MLEKKAELSIGKDSEGWIIVEEATKRGVRMPDESLLQLTLTIWEYCDKHEAEDLTNQLIGDASLSDQQKTMVRKIVDDTLGFFVEVGWAVPRLIS
jgi:hypothetical protein